MRREKKDRGFIRRYISQQIAWNKCHGSEWFTDLILGSLFCFALLELLRFYWIFFIMRISVSLACASLINEPERRQICRFCTLAYATLAREAQPRAYRRSKICYWISTRLNLSHSSSRRRRRLDDGVILKCTRTMIRSDNTWEHLCHREVCNIPRSIIKIDESDEM